MDKSRDSLRILHIGAFDRNIGDNIALYNAKLSWQRHNRKIIWSNFDIGQYWFYGGSKKDLIKNFSEFKDNFDAILVGGGGLIEYGGYEDKLTGYKLPFDKEILKAVEIPVFFHGVGVNIFRGGIDYNDKAKKALQETIDYSAGFSVRNDGSFQKLKNWLKLDVTNVDVVPDPGLLYLDKFYSERKYKLSKGGIQPAFNGSSGINIERFKDNKNIDYLSNFTKDLILYPHTLKDYNRFKAKPIISQEEFTKDYTATDQVYKFLEFYKEVDYLIAMRGHGQLISLGIGLPGIYFSTQDKVEDFSNLNGFENYNVDILNPKWKKLLKEKINELTKDNSQYLLDWYALRDSNLSVWHQKDFIFVNKALTKYEL